MGVKDQNVIACKEGFGQYASRGKQRVAQLEHQANCLRERLSYLEHVLPFGTETVESEKSCPEKCELSETIADKNSKCLLQTLAAKEKTLRKEIYDMKRTEESYVKTLADKFTGPKDAGDPSETKEAPGKGKGVKEKEDVKTRLLRLEAYGKKLCTNLRNLQKNRCDLTQEAEDLSKELDLTREGLCLRKKRSRKRCPNLLIQELGQPENVDKKAKVVCRPPQRAVLDEDELKERSGCPCGELAKCRSCTICSCAEWEQDLYPNDAEEKEAGEVLKENETAPIKQNEQFINDRPVCQRCKAPKRSKSRIMEKQSEANCVCFVASASETSCECDYSDELDYDSSTMSLDMQFDPDCATLAEDACLPCQSSCSVCHACQHNSKLVKPTGLHNSRNVERCRGGVDPVTAHDEPSYTSNLTCVCGTCVKTKKGCCDLTKSTAYKNDDVGSIPETVFSDITCTCNLCDRTALLEKKSNCSKKERLSGAISCVSSSKRYHNNSSDDFKLERGERCRGGDDTDPSMSKCTCSCTLCVLRNSEGNDAPSCCNDGAVVKKEELPSDRDDHDVEVPVSSAMSAEITELCQVTQLRESLEKLKNRNYALRKLLQDCGCQATLLTPESSHIPNTTNGPGVENSGDQLPSKMRAPSTSGLIVTLKMLQSKCRIKDGMIVALADELKRNGSPAQTSRILRSLADPDLSKETNDFDRTTLWTYLTETAQSTTQRCVSGDLDTSKDFVFGSIVLLLVLFSTVVQSNRFSALTKLTRQTLRNAHQLIAFAVSRAENNLAETLEKVSAAFDEYVSLLMEMLTDGLRFFGLLPVVKKRMGNGVYGAGWVECLREFFGGSVELWGKWMESGERPSTGTVSRSEYVESAWFTFYLVVLFVLVAMLCLLSYQRSLKSCKSLVVGQYFRKSTFIYVLCASLGYVTNKLLNNDPNGPPNENCDCGEKF